MHCHLLGVPGRTPEEKMARLLEVADRHKIEKLCLFFSSTWAKTPTAEELKADNDYVIQAMSHWTDRVYGFCYVSPEHVEASLEEIESLHRERANGGDQVMDRKRANAPELDAIIRKATEAKAIIFQHTWFKQDGTQNPGESTPLELAELARRFPDTHFICVMRAGNGSWGFEQSGDCQTFRSSWPVLIRQRVSQRWRFVN